MVSELKHRVVAHLEVVYKQLSIAERGVIADSLIDAMHIVEAEAVAKGPVAGQFQNHWDERDIIAITYGDSFIEPTRKPLESLHDFLDQYVKGVINSVHILPFFPYSSDDGFSVIDYLTVNPELGDWSDVSSIAGDYKLMADLVINHCSAESRWFKNFCESKSPGLDYFATAEPDDDLSDVVRPRTSPLLRRVETAQGVQHAWCTFSHDQVDLNFENPAVLLEFTRIINDYIEQGVAIFRLDAVAFLWKRVGTSCLNLVETHEIVRLLRSLIEAKKSDAVIITETNIPNRENLSYFGNVNEAHVVYNFSLPPLLLNTLLTGNSHYLKNWLMSMPPAQMGTTYLNFFASHDGIGLRPAEGLLSEEEIQNLIDVMESHGGSVSWRALESGVKKPYEINISLFDALRGTVNGEDSWQFDRFYCAHAIVLALEGIPAIYVHSLLATGNDYERKAASGHNRGINRHQWDYDLLKGHLSDSDSQHYQVFSRLKSLIALRIEQPAFHPNATQYTLHLGDQIFAFWRQSLNRHQSIFAIHNISDQTQTIPLTAINLVGTDDWIDLVTGNHYRDLHGFLELKPYQFIWLTNKAYGAC